MPPSSPLTKLSATCRRAFDNACRIWAAQESEAERVSIFELRTALPQRARSRAQVGINYAVELFGTYSGSRMDMANWLEDAEINTDRNLRLQYLAGLGLNQYDAASIYRELIQETRYPEHLFEGSEETLAELRTFVDRALGVSRQGF